MCPGAFWRANLCNWASGVTGLRRLLEIAVLGLNASSGRLHWDDTTYCVPAGALQEASDGPTLKTSFTGASGDVGSIVFEMCHEPSATDVRFVERVVEAIEASLDQEAESDASSEIAGRLFESEQRLAETLLQLEASNAQLENFAYIAAHELLHPLRAVTAFADLLPDLVRAGSSEALDASLARIREGTTEMQHQVTALLDLSSVSSDIRSGELIDPSESVRAALDGLTDMYDKVDSDVQVGELPIVRAQTVPLQSIFHNLLVNAFRYRDPDRDLQVHIEGTELDTETIIDVRDNGMGIAGPDLERIFGIFERAAADQSGAGIGLALVQRIMQNAGGAITVTSERGQGSRFRLHFPRVSTSEPVS